MTHRVSTYLMRPRSNGRLASRLSITNQICTQTTQFLPTRSDTWFPTPLPASLVVMARVTLTANHACCRPGHWRAIRNWQASGFHGHSIGKHRDHHSMGSWGHRSGGTSGGIGNPL